MESTKSPPTSDLVPTKTTNRYINHLPPHCLAEHSPYLSLEFDLAVQEYCRNRNNHISHNSDCVQKNSKHKTTNAYNTVNKPFNKIIRSCKVVVSGDVAVGKTCLVNRFGRDLYTNNYQTTIGVDFDIQKYHILGQPYLLQIWDTAGLERFRCITSSYYRGCQAALLVFDMSNLSTLANVLTWKDEVCNSSKTFEQLANEDIMNRKASSDPNQPLIFLVGTKSDLPLTEYSKSFIKEQANKVASLLQAELWFVSAQTGENVNELFNRVAALCFNRTILAEIQKIRFETSTLGACLKEKILQQRRELWHQSSKLIKVTKKREGDDRRSRCVNVQCVIK